MVKHESFMFILATSSLIFSPKTPQVLFDDFQTNLSVREPAASTVGVVE
jgi:hypothetical protein